MIQHPQQTNRPVMSDMRPASRPSTTTTVVPPRLPDRRAWQPKRRSIVVICLVIALLGVAAWFVVGRFVVGSSKIDATKYQAIFLTNGEVYFGKLRGYYTQRPYLENVYYIKTSGGAEANAKNGVSQEQQLIKLGGETHGPEDMMIVNKSAILFVENLTDDSKIVQLIKKS